MNFVVNIALYRQDVMFSFAQTDKELKKALGMDGDEQAMRHLDIEGKNGKCVMLSGGAVVVRMVKIPRTNFDWSILAHELFHATDMILDRKGMRLTDSSDEAYAYLMEYLTFHSYSRL